MPASKFEKLNTGAEMPTIGLGTWKSLPGEVEHSVEFALRNGYTHIDTASAYDNEKEVGQGIKASGVPREKIFLVTKLFNTDHTRVEEAFLESIEKLGTSYVDLWLMHWPAPFTKDNKPDRSVDWLDTWKEMERVYKAHPDKLKAIGVSNFSIAYLERLLKDATVVPAANQIELHPSCTQEDLVAYCISKGIVVTSWPPLGSDNSPLLKNETVNKLAQKYGVTPANILISFQANRPGVTVLPKSVKNQRIIENAKVIDIADEDMAELFAIDKTHHFRVANPNWTGWGSLGFPDCE